MLALCTLLSLALADEKDGFYALPDAGVTLAAPAWHMSRWSDWDWKGRTLDNGAIASVWYTPFQVAVDESTRDAVIANWTKKLSEEEHGEDIQFSAPTIADEGGKHVIRAQASFKAGDTKAVFYGAAFATEGKLVHLGAYAAGANAGRAKAGLDGLVDKAAISKQPADLSALANTVGTTSATLALPVGWRPPLPAEQADVEAMYSRTLAKDTDKCAPAIHVVGPGVADLVLLCEDGPEMGIVDEYSVADDAAVFAKSMFGKAAEKLAPGEAVTTPHGLSVLVHVNDGLYVAGIPMSKGSATAWFVGRPEADAELSGAAKAIVAGSTFAGDKNPAPAFGAIVAHTLSYNPTHPAVLAAAALFAAILGAFGWLVLKKAPAPPTTTY